RARGQVGWGGTHPAPVGGAPQAGRRADSAARTGHYDEFVPERFLRVAHGPFRVVYSAVIYPVRSARVTVIIDCPPMVPTAVQVAGTGHDTVNSSVSTVPGGTRVACSRQRVPSHVSVNPPGGARSLAASTPTAVHDLGEVQETLLSWLRPRGVGFGVAWTRQAVPFQASARFSGPAFWLKYEPTAVQ